MHDLADMYKGQMPFACRDLSKQLISVLQPLSTDQRHLCLDSDPPRWRRHLFQADLVRRAAIFVPTPMYKYIKTPRVIIFSLIRTILEAAEASRIDRRVFTITPNVSP